MVAQSMGSRTRCVVGTTWWCRPSLVSRKESMTSMRMRNQDSDRATWCPSFAAMDGSTLYKKPRMPSVSSVRTTNAWRW